MVVKNHLNSFSDVQDVMSSTVSVFLHESLKSAQGLCPYVVSLKSLALVDVLQILFF